MQYRIRLIWILLLLSMAVYAAEEPAAKPPVYGGTTVKLDIGTPALTAGMSKGKLQQYELAVNVQLVRKVFPTLELGYAGGRAEQGDSIQYHSHGGYFRVGLDVNPLKKHPESPHAMLLGIRVGTGIQPKHTDCWGEIVGGCQVEICTVENKKTNTKSAFYMGWMGRLKIMFTRQKGAHTADEMWPIYVPGFGTRDNIGWGLSYHLGWKF